MILQSLVSYYEALAQKGEISRSGWEKVKVSYALEIDGNGQLLSLLPLKKPTEDGKRMVAREMELPARVKKASGIKSNFLCENAAYFLGLGDSSKPQRVLECFAAAKETHQTVLHDLEIPYARAICSFFDTWDTGAARENPILLPYLEDLQNSANLVFFYEEQYPQENADIAEVWQQYYDRDEAGEKMPCLVTGRASVPAAIHPSIKGVSGAQSSGAALVSFNAPAYCSFGREQNYNAPVGKYAAFAYTTALNHLLSDRKHLKRIGDATVVYWAEDLDSVYQDLLQNMLDREDANTMSDNDLDVLMDVISEGKAVNWEGVPLNPDNRFYILALAPNAARISVRFFLAEHFGNIVRHLREHYKRLEIVTDNRSRFRHIPLWKLLQEIENEKSKDKIANNMLRAILTGGYYPATLYQQTQLHIRAERIVTRERAAIIRAYLWRNTENPNYKEALTVELNEQTTYQPYVLGRLFAVLEEVQNKASNVSTIKDKYFTSACATPAVVFPTIINLSDKHLRKLDGGAKIHYAKRIGELMASITSSYPAHHNMVDQGIFQLGYYHQTQKRYQKKNNNEITEEGNQNV